MSLMKWFRKNNRKIMAVAVVGLMIVFIGGSALRMSCGNAGPGPRQTIAMFGEKEKITRADIEQANTELAILQQIQADAFLRSQNIHGLFLAEIIFSENRISPRLIDALRRSIRNEQLRISDEQIAKLYEKKQTNEIYWHLLKKEAQNAGVTITNENAANILRQIIPRLFQGYSYSQVMNSFLNRRISEENVLSTFARLYAVLEYARNVCSNESLTRAQLSRIIRDERQRLDAELVMIAAELFADEQDEPAEERAKEHFEKYKTYYPYEVTEENPYGFGYKIENRAQLEYIAVKLDDIKQAIKEPTQEEKERYYLSHTHLFTYEMPLDPNDPNSPMIEDRKTFGQVAGLITNRMINERINEKTDSILVQAAELAEKPYLDVDPAELTLEELKGRAVDFEKIADTLDAKNSVKVYSGKTGLLSIEDMQNDDYVSGLYVVQPGQQQMPIGLTELVFSMGPFESTALTLMEAPANRLYQSIGPLKDIQNNISAIVRVVDVKKSNVPENLDVSFSTKSLRLDESEPAQNEDAYSIRKQVVKDLKELAAMQTAKEKAEEFMSLAQEQTWDHAVDKFNSEYPPKEPDGHDNFKMTVWTDAQRPSAILLETITERNKNQAGSHLIVDLYKQRKMALDTLFDLVPADSDTLATLPMSIEIKPVRSYYCVKDLSIKKIDRNEYDKIKAVAALRQDGLESQNLGAEFFQPDNILERMNFRLTIERPRPVEPNEPNSESSTPQEES